MKNKKLQLLDCTLRDGGYVNDWKWGYNSACNIIKALVSAGVDVIETGFLRNIDGYDPDVTVCNYIEELNKLLPNEKHNTIFSAMAMCSNYDINKLTPYSGNGIEMIRITAHDYDLNEGIEFAAKVQEKGYKISINPINIMGYSDKQILFMLDKVNAVEPYQFSIVDTFGSMKRRDLDRIATLVDHNLNKNIRLALHLHENMSLSCFLAQRFIDMNMERPVSVDGSLMGMGRTPGNLPIELIADYLNDYCSANYDIDFMMDAIQDHISPIKGEIKWGYTPAYFLSAHFNLHRNYAEYYLNKGDLTNKDINRILARCDSKMAARFDEKYAESLYQQYMDNRIDDTEARSFLKEKLCGRNILVTAPGKTIESHREKICRYIEDNNAMVISVNFIPEYFNPDYVFCSNNKRFEKLALEKDISELILTSNITKMHEAIHVDYNKLTGSFHEGCNSLVMALKLLKELGINEVVLAGADGYSLKSDNYYRSDIRSYSEHGKDFNIAVYKAFNTLKMKIKYLTPSMYENAK